MQTLTVAAADYLGNYFREGKVNFSYRCAPAPLAMFSLPSVDVEISRYHNAQLNHSLSKRDRLRSNAKLVAEYFSPDILDSRKLNSIVQSEFPTVLLEEYVKESLTKWGSFFKFTNRVTPNRKLIVKHLSKPLNEFEVASKHLLRLNELGLINDQWVMSIANQGHISHRDLAMGFSHTIKEIMPNVNKLSTSRHFCNDEGDNFFVIEAECYEPINTHYLFKDAPVFVSHLLYNTLQLISRAFHIGILPEDFLDSELHGIEQDVKELVKISGASCAEEVIAYFERKGTITEFQGEFIYCEDIKDLFSYQYEIESYFIMRPNIERFENNNNLSTEDYAKRLFDEAVDFLNNSMTSKEKHIVELCINALRQILCFLIFHTYAPNYDYDNEEYNTHFYITCPIFTDCDGRQEGVYMHTSHQWELSIGNCFQLPKDIPPQLMISRLQGLETGFTLLQAFSKFNEELKCSMQI